MSALSTGVFGESREVFLELDFRSGPQHVPTNTLQFALCRSNQSPRQFFPYGFIVTQGKYTYVDFWLDFIRQRHASYPCKSRT